MGTRTLCSFKSESIRNSYTMCPCTECVWHPIHDWQNEGAAQLCEVRHSTAWELQKTKWLAEYSIYVRDVDLLLWEITVNPASTLEDVVQSLWEKGVKIPTMASFYHGCRKILKGSPLQNFGVGKGTNVEVCLGLLGGGKKKKKKREQPIDNVSPPINAQDVSQDEQKSDHNALENLSLKGASGGTEETHFGEDKRPHSSPVVGGGARNKSNTKKNKTGDPAVKSQLGSTSPSQQSASAKTNPPSRQQFDTVDSEDLISQGASGGAEIPPSEGQRFDGKANKSVSEIKELRPENMTDWMDNHVQTWLREIKFNDSSCNKLKQEEVTGAVLVVLSREDCVEFNIPKGQMILMLKKRDEYLSNSLQGTVPVNTKKTTDCTKSELENKKFPESKDTLPMCAEIPALVDSKCAVTVDNNGREIILIDPCPFDSESSKYSYGKGKCLPPESGKGNLVTPCHEYKAFQPGTCSSEEKKMKSFINETLRFASACINSRTNGTIHFGVGDKENGCLHAEVLGVDVSDVRCYQQWLLRGIETCLSTDDERTIVSSCMRAPRFVKVNSSGTHLASNLFVIEVDIVPAHETCGNRCIRVKLIPDTGKTAKEIAFKRDRDLSENIGNVEQYLQTYLPVLIKRRLKCEEEARISITERKAMYTGLDLKLTKCITGGGKTLDESTYDHYILVTNRPEIDSNLNDLIFVKEIPCLAVLDFNSTSSSNGLYKMFRENKLAVQLNSPQTYDGWYKGLDKFCNDMKIGKICQWIYCNGWSPLNDSKEAWMDDDMWHRDRSSSVANVINFLCTRVLQTGTYLVVFLLLSIVDSEKDPMLEVFKCFYKEMHGHGHMLCLADNEHVYDKWINLQSIVKPEDLESRCMKGMKLREVNDTVLSIKKETRMNKNFIPEFNGAPCIVDDEIEKDMSTLTLLYLNQCEDCAIEEDENKFRIFKLEEETKYYKGGKINWWLFYFTDRGYSKCWFKRDSYDSLKRAITRQEQNTHQSVKIVNLFHHPGCGGTTMGMNVLWDLRNEFRCAVVNDNLHNTSEIAKHVVQLLTFNKEDDANIRQEDGFISVLLLLDNAAIDVGRLCKNISKEIDGKGCRVTRPTVFILNCSRTTNPKTQCEENPHTSIPLTHTLTRTETTAIVEKHNELEKEHLEKTKSFISFMIMKNNFSIDYVTKLVEDSLQSVPNSRELHFLAYVALLSVYVEDFSLPVSHCQQFFGISGYLSNFRIFLHESISFLLIDLQREQYNLYKAIRIVHPMVAEVILKHLYSKMSTDLRKIALDFFSEEAMFHHRFAQDDFMKSVNEMLIKRQYKEHRHPLDSLSHVATEQIDAEELELDKAHFSNLVIAICEESKGEVGAIEVLEQAFKMLREEPFSAFVAQAIARLLIKSKKYDDAKIWAKKACDIRKNNPFIFNTLGQTYRAELKNTFQRKIVKKERMQEHELCKALQLAKDASHWFKESQEAQSQESTTINVSGFLDELDVALYVIKLLSLTGMFHCDSPLGKLSLQNYLMKDTETLPSPISSLWASYHDYLKNLAANIERCMDWVIREVLYHKVSDFMLKRYYQLCETYMDVCQIIYNPQQLSKKKDVIANTVGDDIKLKMAGGSNFEFLLKKLFDPQMENRLSEIFLLLKYLMNAEDIKYFPHYFIVNCAICYFGPLGTQATNYQEMYNKGLELADRLCRGIRESTPYPYFVITLLLLPHLENLTEEQTRYVVASLEQMYTLYIRHAAKKAFTISTKNTILYLGQGDGYSSIVHRTQLHQCCEFKQWHEQRKWWFQDVWTNSKVREKLKRMRGFVREQGKILISTNYEDLNIPVTPSNLSYTRCISYIEEVEFFVAYSLCGLFAYDIKPVRASRRNVV